MNDGRLVPRESATYREFARLYELARRLRPSAVDRWNGDLYATGTKNWGEFAPKSGDMRLSGPLVLQHLTAAPGQISPGERAQALGTVLHEATHAGMATDAPDEPNAVRSPHSAGLMEGIAEVRTVQDFPAFARLAGHPGLALPASAYPGAHAATQNVLQQASGPAVDRLALLGEAVRGPAVMHFDQLAEGVVRNRLEEGGPLPIGGSASEADADDGADRVHASSWLADSQRHVRVNRSSRSRRHPAKSQLQGRRDSASLPSQPPAAIPRRLPQPVRRTPCGRTLTSGQYTASSDHDRTGSPTSSGPKWTGSSTRSGDAVVGWTSSGRSRYSAGTITRQRGEKCRSTSQPNCQPFYPDSRPRARLSTQYGRLRCKGCG